MNPEELPLRDLHLPADIGWWPLAPGWWVVIALLVAALGYFVFRLWQNWRRGAARREALAAFTQARAQFESDGDVAVFITSVSTLLRRAMLSCERRQDVAGIVGDDWLRLLDRGLKRPGFENGVGRCLAELPYRPQPALQPAELDELSGLVKQRLRTLPGSAG